MVATTFSLCGDPQKLVASTFSPCGYPQKLVASTFSLCGYPQNVVATSFCSSPTAKRLQSGDGGGSRPRRVLASASASGAQHPLNENDPHPRLGCA